MPILSWQASDEMQQQQHGDQREPVSFGAPCSQHPESFGRSCWHKTPQPASHVELGKVLTHGLMTARTSNIC